MNSLLLRFGLLFALLVPLAPPADAQLGVARAAVTAAKVQKFAVASTQANLNLRTFANGAGYGGSGNVEITINGGVEIYSGSTGTAAIVTGSWPAGVRVTLIVNGTVSGAGGAGGNGYIWGTARPTTGLPGGTALDATGVSGFSFYVTNAGTLRGGGGGGAGGAGHTAADTITYAGGGGGGGQGRNGGGGGASGGTASDAVTAASAGGAGSPAGAGAGGSDNGPDNWRGGDGGAWGTAGATNVGATGDINFDGPRTGGAAGNAVTGNANINWIATGTRTGPIT